MGWLAAGGLGQLGADLAKVLRAAIGTDNVLSTDVRIPPRHQLAEGGRLARSPSRPTPSLVVTPRPTSQPGPFAYCDVLDYRGLETLVVNHQIDWVIHLSALLSAVGEQNVQKALTVNNVGFQVRRPSSRGLRWARRPVLTGRAC